MIRWLRSRKFHFLGELRRQCRHKNELRCRERLKHTSNIATANDRDNNFRTVSWGVNFEKRVSGRRRGVFLCGAITAADVLGRR